jgi:TetR/AcrR family transcriptional regulator
MSQIVKKSALRDPACNHAKEAVILQAARRRFAQYGFSKVTMEEVADDVGVVKGSVYYYFSTKEKLFEAVICKEHRQFMEEIEKALRHGIPRAEMLRKYVDKRLHFSREFLALSQVDYQEWMRLRSHFQDLLASFEQEELAFLQQILEEGQASGEFALTNPRRLASLFLHTLQGLRFRAMRDPQFMKQDEKANGQIGQEVRLFTEIFLRSINRAHHEGPRSYDR